MVWSNFLLPFSLSLSFQNMNEKAQPLSLLAAVTWRGPRGNAVGGRRWPVRGGWSQGNHRDPELEPWREHIWSLSTCQPFSYGEPVSLLYSPHQHGLGSLELTTESLPDDSHASWHTLNGIQTPYLCFKGLLTSNINEWWGQGLVCLFPWYDQPLWAS